MTIKEMANCIVLEAKELLEETEKDSHEEMKEELGDVLAICLYFAVLAEEKGYFSVKDSLQNAIGKFKRRKPWIFKEMGVNTVDQARALWDEAKQKEKQSKALKKPKP